jgi:molybdopterin molybdotransferase
VGALEPIMLTVDEALDAVRRHARPVTPIRVPLAQALGAVLAEDVMADLDLPPFDKALVDGFAVRSADLVGSNRELVIGETIAAGQVPSRPLGQREAAKIMTGAPVPVGADLVVMIERTRRFDDRVAVDDPGVRPGQNVLPRGREMRSGEVIAKPGTPITPAMIGLLASVGWHDVLVRRASVAILPTGDELVEPEFRPGPGQIRNSNAPMLEALSIEAGAIAERLPIAPDEPLALERSLERGLAADVLVITGGVSAGDRDLVPAALMSLGARLVFHKVRLKPGKPLWFGTGPDRDGRPGTLIFGLPGNPVSGLVGFLIFVREAIAFMTGGAESRGAPRSARLARGFQHRGDRPTYHPARFEKPALVENPALPDGGAPSVETLDWAGSADLRSVAGADGFAVFPPGDRDYAQGEIVSFLSMR